MPCLTTDEMRALADSGFTVAASGALADAANKIDRLKAQCDAAVQAASVTRTALCVIADLAEHGDWGTPVCTRSEIVARAKVALDETALHPHEEGMWQGMAVECKGWEKRAIDAEAQQRDVARNAAETNHADWLRALTERDAAEAQRDVLVARLGRATSFDCGEGVSLKLDLHHHLGFGPLGERHEASRWFFPWDEMIHAYGAKAADFARQTWETAEEAFVALETWRSSGR